MIIKVMTLFLVLTFINEPKYLQTVLTVYIINYMQTLFSYIISIMQDLLFQNTKIRYAYVRSYTFRSTSIAMNEDKQSVLS